MFLSDKLIEIGRKSNPKNNLSMADALAEMKAECQRAVKGGEMEARAKAALTLACNTLTKEGYTGFSNKTT